MKLKRDVDPLQEVQVVVVFSQVAQLWHGSHVNVAELSSVPASHEVHQFEMLPHVTQFASQRRQRLVSVSSKPELAPILITDMAFDHVP